MNKLFFVLVIVVSLFLISCDRNEILQVDEQQSDLVKFSMQIIPGKYIVMFKDEGLLKSASKGEKVAPEAVMQTANSVFSMMNIPMDKPDFVYHSAIRGIAIGLEIKEAQKLIGAPGVKGVYPDMMVTLDLPTIQGKPSPPTPTETIPYGITRVGGGATYNGTSKAWIIDTGIDLDHPDLNVDQGSGYNFIANTQLADDDHGHGTHCAGIVGAIGGNSKGVVGVAAGVNVVPVKVLNRRGSGAYSVIIAGVDFVKNNHANGDVANMSLGGSPYTPIDNAVASMAASGVRVSLAAGNESDNANNHSPARVNGPNIYTISAMDKNNFWAYFSNYGNPPVDFCAPGVNILSLYKGGTTATMSGTSMAAPHVCGLLLLGNISTDGYVNGDPDGNLDPIAHK